LKNLRTNYINAQTRTKSGDASHGPVWSYNCWVC